MQVDQFIVNVNSERPDELISFYKDVVGLTPGFDVAPGAFKAGSSSYISFIIEGHSAVHGSNKEPERVLLNFTVDDVAAEQRRLEARGVRFIRDATEEPGWGVFSTFQDPDGNCCQLVQLYDQA
jgi:predicted enzyme related to lactoylglutathione lyase